MNHPTAHNSGLISWFLLMTLSAIWGASFFSVSIALDSFTPLQIVAIRISLAAVILTLIAFILGYGLPSLFSRNGLKIWLHCFGMGLFSNAIPFSFLSWGQQYVSSSFAGISMALVPLFVLPLSFFFIKDEKLSIRKILGFCLGFIGILILLGPSSILDFEKNSTTFARIACIAAAICYAIGSIITRRCPNVNLISFSAGALILSSLTVIPFVLRFETIPDNISINSMLAIIYLGFMPTAVATVLLVRIIQTAGPTFYSQANYQVPIWSIIFGTVLLNETLSIQFYFAFLIILTGIVIAQTNITNFQK